MKKSKVSGKTRIFSENRSVFLGKVVDGPGNVCWYMIFKRPAEDGEPDGVFETTLSLSDDAMRQLVDLYMIEMSLHASENGWATSTSTADLLRRHVPT